MSNLDHDFLLQTVSDFIAYVVLPGIDERGLADALVWRQRDDGAFQGSVLAVSDDLFRIALNRGLVDGLYARVERLAALDDPALVPVVAGIARALEDLDRGLNMVFVSGLVFTALHEAAHAAAGHPDYRRREPEAGQGGWPADYRVMDELEADGVATALTLDFAPEIAGMLVDGDTPDAALPLTTGAILGIFLALSAMPRTAAPGYPAGQVRVLNALSAMVWRVADVTLAGRDGDWFWPDLDDAGAERAAQAVQQGLVPALMVLAEIEGPAAGFPMPLTPYDAPEDEALRQDVVAMLGGARPGQSRAGRDLSRLSDLRPAYMQALERFRRTGLWTET